MKSVFRKLALVGGLGLAGNYVVTFLQGPHGWPLMQERRARIQKLVEQNAELARQNQLTRERIKRLTDDVNEQDVEIRRRLDKAREGETVYVVPGK